MLGKLLKHEFRATGRTLLPVIGAVVLLAALANISIRVLNVTDSTFLTILFGLIVAAFVIGIIAAMVMTAVVMVMRFYRSLLKDEGYLMHTLPVSVHSLVWSKLIVSLVWFVVTGLVIWLVMMLTVLIQSGTNLGDLVQGLDLEELKAALAEMGFPMSKLWGVAGQLALAGILSILVSCLHFYAAMSMGHMFSKDKILLSIVFFVAISFLFSILSTGYSVGTFSVLENDLVTSVEGLRLFQAIIWRMMLLTLIQGGILYAATVLSLKKGLNLA